MRVSSEDKMEIDVLVVLRKADLFVIGIVLGIAQSLCISQDYLNSALLVDTCGQGASILSRKSRIFGSFNFDKIAAEGIVYQRT